MEPSGIVMDIDRFSSHDGPGIRTAIFLKGCPLRCAWCHSPESQCGTPQLIYRQARCVSCHRCVEACPVGAITPGAEGIAIDRQACTGCLACVQTCAAGALSLCGRTYALEELMAIIGQDVPFFRNSGGGVTVSGGEPLMQAGFVEALFRACKAQGVHTALETCGQGDSAALLRIAARCDLIYYDIKLLDSAAHKRWTGVGNEGILANLTTLCEAYAPRIVARTPLIPGITDSPAQIEAISRHVQALGIERMELMRYNASAAGKYAWLGMEYPLGALEPQSDAYMEQLNTILHQYKLYPDTKDA